MQSRHLVMKNYFQEDHQSADSHEAGTRARAMQFKVGNRVRIVYHGWSYGKQATIEDIGVVDEWPWRLLGRRADRKSVVEIEGGACARCKVRDTSRSDP